MLTYINDLLDFLENTLTFMRFKWVKQIDILHYATYHDVNITMSKCKDENNAFTKHQYLNKLFN